MNPLLEQRQAYRDEPNNIENQQPSGTDIDAEVAALERHLAAVADKVLLCREILLESPGIEQDDLLSSIIGFLEACSERMPDIIEAGASGLISEELLSEALRVNDSLQRTLEAERTGVKIPVQDEAPSKAEANLLDFDDSSPVVKAAPSKVQASLLEADDDAGLDYKSSKAKFDNKKNFKPVGHHLGSQYPARPSPQKELDPSFLQPTPVDSVFGTTTAQQQSSTVGVNDIDLLLHDDSSQSKTAAPKKEEDFDAFLDSIGASSIK